MSSVDYKLLIIFCVTFSPAVQLLHHLPKTHQLDKQQRKGCFLAWLCDLLALQEQVDGCSRCWCSALTRHRERQPRRAPAIARVRVCAFFLTLLWQRGLYKEWQRLSSRPHRDLQTCWKSSLWHTCLDNLNCCPFFSQDSLLFTTVQTRARTHAKLLFTPSTLLCPVLSVFYSHLWHGTARWRTVSQQKGFQGVPVPWGARAFSVWTLHVSGWFLPNCCP